LINLALDNARNGGVRAVNGRLISESAISIRDSPGRLIVVDSPNGGPNGSLIENKVYLVGRRLYSMQVAIPRDEGSATEISSSLQNAALMFLDSFALTKAATSKAKS
jgi:hypothetical protein